MDNTVLAITTESSIYVLLSTIFGYIFRMMPEFTSLLHKYLDNKHELAMLEKSNKVQDNTVNDKVSIASSPEVDMSFIDKLIKVQNTKSGIFIADLLNTLVRPTVAYSLVAVYIAIKLVYMYTHPDFLITEVWTREDMMLLGGILGFFYLGRVLGK